MKIKTQKISTLPLEILQIKLRSDLYIVFIPVFPVSVQLIPDHTHGDIIQPLDMAYSPGVGVVSPHQLQFEFIDLVNIDPSSRATLGS